MNRTSVHRPSEWSRRGRSPSVSQDMELCKDSEPAVGWSPLPQTFLAQQSVCPGSIGRRQWRGRFQAIVYQARIRRAVVAALEHSLQVEHDLAILGTEWNADTRQRLANRARIELINAVPRCPMP